MKVGTLDKDEKKIVRAVIHSEGKRRNRRQRKRETEFDKKASAAIQKAKEEMYLGETSEKIRESIIEKIYISLSGNVPWELMGETYCCRSLFYSYRNQFCYLIAINLGIVEPEERNNRKEQKKKVD